jgi:hypothetical protein
LHNSSNGGWLRCRVSYRVSVGDPSILGQVARALTSTIIDLSTVPGGPTGLSFARPSR